MYDRFFESGNENTNNVSFTGVTAMRIARGLEVRDFRLQPLIYIITFSLTPRHTRTQTNT